MVFSDLFFLFVFLPAFALCYLWANRSDKKGAPHDRMVSCATRNMVLVVFSLLFYAWGEPVYVFLMLGSVVVNFFIGRIIDRQRRFRRAALIFGVAADIAILGVFKYANFIVDQCNALGAHLSSPRIALPIGISFYIFQSISYLVDVYRRESPAQRRFVDLLLYISMFPQLIAGPIVRYSTVAEGITAREVRANDVAEGMYRFLRGLAKKVIFANQLYEVSHQFLDGKLESLSMSGAWIGVIAFTLQIYFDFSGYSDMAIGLGRCLGFRFNENFDHPYCSKTITEFWRRWHMSLGSFFRDYVYIPMGGNRRHQPLNILVVWFLTGMWHGASWNFIIWGLFYGVIVYGEKHTLLPRKDRIPGALLHFYTMLLVTLGFGIFYFDDFTRLKDFFFALCGGTHLVWDGVSEAALLDHFWLWVAAVLLCMPLRGIIDGGLDRLAKSVPSVGRPLALVLRFAVSVAVLVLCTALLVGATNNAFIYTRF